MSYRGTLRRCMTYAEKLSRLAYYCLWIAVVGVAAWGLTHFSARAPIDPQTGSAGLAVETDAATGCQYVVTPWGGIFARLGRDGKPLCKAPPG